MDHIQIHMPLLYYHEMTPLFSNYIPKMKKGGGISGVILHHCSQKIPFADYILQKYR